MHAFLHTTYDITPSLYTHTVTPDGSIGIDEIRQLQKLISTLPPQNQIRRLVIFQAEKMTIPAQNAFLKTLEEPPVQTEIHLVTGFPDQLLPTILSRIQTVRNSPNRSYTSAGLENSRKLFLQLQFSGVGERLAVINSQNFNRESFLQFLSDLEYILHDQLPQFTDPAKTYQTIILTKQYTNANCNLRLVASFFASQIVLQ